MSALDELKAIPQWIGWNAEQRGDKVTKIPKNPYNGRNAASNNPETWSDVSTAWRAVKRHGWSGLGFVFTIRAGIVGVDLDNCFNADGQLESWAYDVYKILDSYTELSPSGNGLHILCRGEIDNSINRSEQGLEMYNELRYFTVTGDLYGPEKPIAERTQQLRALHFCFSDTPRQEQTPPTNYNPRTVNEKEIAEALKYIPKRMDYYDWLRVLMAVHDAFPNGKGVSLCESWSPGYKGEIAHKFNSFDRTSKSGVTVATLFHMAKQHGWQKARPQRTKRMSHKEKMRALAAA